MTTVQRRVRVHGRVQGVGFRAATRDFVLSLGEVRGWVANRVDGSVEAVFSGPDAAVMRCVAWCRKGPSYAQVDRLEVFEESVVAHDQDKPEFEIRHDRK